MIVLIIGFGNMGARHLQSLTSKLTGLDVHILESNKSVFLENLKMINVRECDVSYHKNFISVPKKIDFSIVATPAEPRFDITSKLLEFNVDKILLEKVVFQSDIQFKNILRRIENSNVQIYCNFVSRYYMNFINLKNSIQGEKIKMVVNGDDFGLACNTLHFIDLFQYITGSKCKIIHSELIEDERGNKRGVEYIELNGELTAISERGDKLYIKDNQNKKDGLDLLIFTHYNFHIFKYKEKSHKIFGTNGSKYLDFQIKYTSELTAQIYLDILNDCCLLPTLSEARSAHKQFFKVVNDSLNIKANGICPIT